MPEPVQQPAPGLRERQLQLTRETILDACADLVNQRRHLGFTMQEIATSAGMALRTVYNHYPTREDLLDALMVHLDERMEVLGGVSTDDLSSLAGVVDAVRVNFEIFEALGGVSEAVAQMSVTEAHRNLERNARTDRFVAMAASEWPKRDQAPARKLGLLVRHLAKSSIRLRVNP